MRIGAYFDRKQATFDSVKRSLTNMVRYSEGKFHNFLVSGRWDLESKVCGGSGDIDDVVLLLFSTQLPSKLPSLFLSSLNVKSTTSKESNLLPIKKKVVKPTGFAASNTAPLGGIHRIQPSSKFLCSYRNRVTEDGTLSEGCDGI